MDVNPEDIDASVERVIDVNVMKEKFVRDFAATAVRNGIPLEEALSQAREQAEQMDFLALAKQRVYRFLDHLTIIELFEMAKLLKENPVLMRYLQALEQIIGQECIDEFKKIEKERWE